jgi:hypothetical protein
MNKEAQLIFDLILSKPKAELTQIDIAFLKARSSYLTLEQTAEYKDILKSKEPKPLEDKSSQKEEALSIIAGRNLSDLTSKELRRIAVRLGVIHKNTTREELLLGINTVLGQEIADKPE